MSSAVGHAGKAGDVDFPRLRHEKPLPDLDSAWHGIALHVHGWHLPQFLKQVSGVSGCALLIQVPFNPFVCRI
jgi:hypothetical protein